MKRIFFYLVFLFLFQFVFATDCVEGQTQFCTNVSGTSFCPGERFCIEGVLGECIDNSEDDCVPVESFISVKQLNPLTHSNASLNQAFTFESTVTCNNFYCGNITAILDPEIEVKIEEGTDEIFIRKNKVISEKRLIIGQYYKTGFRFNDIPILPQSKINSATLEVIAKNWSSKDFKGVNVVFRTEISENAETFSDYENFISRKQSNAFVEWNNVPYFSLLETYSSPDLSPIIQELIGSLYWDKGDSIVIFVEDNNSFKLVNEYGTPLLRDIVSYKNWFWIPDKQAVLKINYSENETYKGQVPTEVGAKPFYTSSENPKSVLI